nr:MAG TPA: hypothetical protein [Caudoviricetes sp.]
MWNLLHHFKYISSTFNYIIVIRYLFSIFIIY